ncbi:MAG: hypothetical protein ACK5PF_09425 [bacterium]
MSRTDQATISVTAQTAQPSGQPVLHPPWQGKEQPKRRRGHGALAGHVGPGDAHPRVPQAVQAGVGHLRLAGLQAQAARALGHRFVQQPYPRPQPGACPQAVAGPE